VRIPLFQLDAFAPEPFSGNPAAVCLLDEWLDDALLQAVAAENNLSETAFLAPAGGRMAIRWFTPECEVRLCGHATLAAGAVILEESGTEATEVEFDSAAGPLRVVRVPGGYAVELPARPGRQVPVTPALEEALQAPVLSCVLADYRMAVLDDEAAVRSLSPDLDWIAAQPEIGLIVTAAGDDADFVSRFFAPGVGVAEDPVTGSAHCTLVPYWAKRLGQDQLRARQLSVRGGELECENLVDRVRLAGKVRPYLRGEITLPA
jgi:predicted PhzF superfamily epimerase YddE/YHI9